MRVTRMWVLSALPFALAACGGGGAAVENAADTTASPTLDTAATTTTPMPGDSASMGGAQAMGGGVTMNAVGNSGVTGQTRLMDHGGQTMVNVTLMAQGNSTHSGHIHQGTCDNIGPVVAPLQDVALNNGNGTSNSTVPIPLATVMNGQHVVSYHQSSGENPGAPVVCGQIPAQQGGTTGTAM